MTVFDDLFENVFNNSLFFSSTFSNIPKKVEDGIEYKLIYAGYSKDDISVDLDSKALIVTVDGKVKQRLPLYRGYDYSKTKAKMKHGLLSIFVPFISNPNNTGNIKIE